MMRFWQRTQGSPTRQFALESQQTESEPWSLQGSSLSHFMKSTVLRLLWKPRTKRPFSAGRRNAQGQPLVIALTHLGRHGGLPLRDPPVDRKRCKHGKKGGEMLKWLLASPMRRAQVTRRFSATRLDSADSAAHSMPAGKYSDRREGCGNYVHAIPPSRGAFRAGGFHLSVQPMAVDFLTRSTRLSTPSLRMTRLRCTSIVRSDRSRM